MIPMADENPIRRFPWCTVLLILACTVVYFGVQPSKAIRFSWSGIAESTNANDLRFVVGNAGIPCELVRGRPLTQQEYEQTFDQGNADACTHGSGPEHDPGKNVYLAAVLTMFLHVSIAHLFGNMLFLWVFGNNIEDRKGWWRFLLLYLSGGAIATAAQVAIDPSSTVPVVGASGAIAAVMGAYFVLWPQARIKTIVVVGPVLLRKVQALWLLLFWLASQLFLVGSGVAWAAHLGGFTFGAAVGCWWRWRDRAHTRPALTPAASPA